jgi:hypothetical protein
MSESSLSLSRQELLQEIGRFCAYGSDRTAWDTNVAAEVEVILKRGLRNFYKPAIIPELGVNHEWSFLKPVTTIATVSGDYDYDLPDSFGSIMGTLTFSADTGYAPIVICSENVIRKYLSQDDSSSRPLYAAIRPKTHSASRTQGQRFEILFYPTPDDAYTLSYRYRVLPDALSASNIYPWGGETHSETILASCLAVAELQKDRVKGVMYEEFRQQLLASVEADRKQAPDTLGVFKSNPNDDSVTMRRLHVVTVEGFDVET